MVVARSDVSRQVLPPRRCVSSFELLRGLRINLRMAKVIPRFAQKGNNGRYAGHCN